MAVYLSIDGDDTGNKLAKGYLDNDEKKLANTVHELNAILVQISAQLKIMGFDVIFCAADGIVCKGVALEGDSFSHYIKNIGKPNFTFSVGVGNDLRTSFFALKYAKATGKDKIVIFGLDEQFKIVE